MDDSTGRSAWGKPSACPGWDIDNGFFLALNIGRELFPYGFLEYELVGWNTTVEDPRRGGTESITAKSESFATLVLQGVLPYGGLRPYLGVSAGLFHSTLIPEDRMDAEKEDWSLGYQLLAGIDFLFLGRHSVGAEVRRTYLRADFGEAFGGEQELGGKVVALAYRYWIP